MSSNAKRQHDYLIMLDRCAELLSSEIRETTSAKSDLDRRIKKINRGLANWDDEEVVQASIDTSDYLRTLTSGRVFVYFVQIDIDGPIKIGTTCNLRRRLQTLTVPWLFSTLTVVATVPGYQQTEQYLHEYFKDLKITGEWFKPSVEILDFIKLVTERHPTPRVVRRCKHKQSWEK